MAVANVFDSLAWNDDLSWWTTSAELPPGHRIDLHVQAPNDREMLRSSAARATPDWERLVRSEPSIRATVASQMTPGHNDFCNPEDVVTESQFAERMELLSVLFEASGSTELVYFDGYLFGGHHIIVPVSSDGVVGEAMDE
jgi:hypothetical protein